MSNDVCFLIAVLYHSTGGLIRCAMKFNRDDLPGDCAQYPMEPENRDVLHALLPSHVQSCGPIVEVTELFEIKDKS